MKTGKKKGTFTGKDDPRRCKAGPGRPPKARCIPEILQELGAADCPETLTERITRALPHLAGRELTLQQACMAMTYVQALKGERWALEFIADRTEGKPEQAITQETVSSVKFVFDPKAKQPEIGQDNNNGE